MISYVCLCHYVRVVSCKVFSISLSSASLDDQGKLSKCWSAIRQLFG